MFSSYLWLVATYETAWNYKAFPTPQALLWGIAEIQSYPLLSASYKVAVCKSISESSALGSDCLGLNPSSAVTSCVTLSKFLRFSVPHFLQL